MWFGDGVEHLACLLRVERGGKRVDEGAVVETRVSGFSIARDFDWERKRVAMETRRIQKEGYRNILRRRESSRQ